MVSYVRDVQRHWQAKGGDAMTLQDFTTEQLEAELRRRREVFTAYSDQFCLDCYGHGWKWQRNWHQCPGCNGTGKRKVVGT